jgi:hypothetical protein
VIDQPPRDLRIGAEPAAIVEANRYELDAVATIRAGRQADALAVEFGHCGRMIRRKTAALKTAALH